MNKKGAELAIRKLVLIVIVLLVLFIALLAFVPMFREKVLGWIKGLPEYKYEYDEEIDVSKLSDEERAGLCSGDLFVGEIVLDERDNEKYWYIDIINKEKKVKILTLVYLDDHKNGNVNLAINRGRDVNIGKITNGRIKIYQDYLDPTDQFIKNIDKLPTLETLRRIHNSYNAGMNILCKTPEDLEKQKQEQIERIEKLKKGTSNMAKLVFNENINDEVSIRWDFLKLRPTILIRPNGEKLLINGKEKWIYSKEDGIFKRKEMEKIHEQDIELIKSLLDAKTPFELSKKIQEILETKRASLNNNGKYDLQIEKINNVLYGLDNAPEQEFELAEDFEVRDGVIYYKGEPTRFYIFYRKVRELNCSKDDIRKERDWDNDFVVADIMDDGSIVLKDELPEQEEDYEILDSAYLKRDRDNWRNFYVQKPLGTYIGKVDYTKMIFLSGRKTCFGILTSYNQVYEKTKDQDKEIGSLVDESNGKGNLFKISIWKGEAHKIILQKLADKKIVLKGESYIVIEK